MVELGSEVWASLVGDTFVTSVIRVGEECLPSFLEALGVDVVSMVLGSNVALACLVVEHRLVLSTVSKRQLLGGSACSQTNQLVSHANTINGFDFFIGTGDDLLELPDSFHAHVWISWTVTEEKTIVLVHLSGELGRATKLP